MTSLCFSIPGEPGGKSRARTYVRQNRDGSTRMATVTPKETRAYESMVKQLCAFAVNRARWSVTKDDRFRLTVRVFRTHEGIGFDLDNVIKAVSDAIQGRGLAIPDDRYVRAISATLNQDAKKPRVEVEVSLLEKGTEHENAAESPHPSPDGTPLRSGSASGALPLSVARRSKRRAPASDVGGDDRQGARRRRDQRGRR